MLFAQFEGPFGGQRRKSVVVGELASQQRGEHVEFLVATRAHETIVDVHVEHDVLVATARLELAMVGNAHVDGTTIRVVVVGGGAGNGVVRDGARVVVVSPCGWLLLLLLIMVATAVASVAVRVRTVASFIGSCRDYYENENNLNKNSE